MSRAPAYFEAIRTRAATRWDQLENDPELAGPWHQLFKQVQSPRHVVSELLQNADDAGATGAAVDIRDGEFIFSHNGEDFTDEHFASLCRFGYSNKRALHTIGFRGIGFKSTFSLGDEVRLLTPTLAVRFGRERFTEPVWIGAAQEHPQLTEVRVDIKDEHRHRELEKNFAEWLRSPAALLFFRHIRSLRIGDQEVRWVSQGAGPVSESEWMTLSSTPDKQYLLIRSTPEEFPPDALEEIKQERMVSVDEETSFPPCRVEIVVGLEGRLFAILPTGVKTALPFACNAPFVQDPARIKIKDPEISPTNRWMLRRAGELAAKGLLAWLPQEDLTLEKRCEAYGLFPDVDRDDNSIDCRCATIAEEAFEDAIEDECYLLTEDGTLAAKKGCVSVPLAILAVWMPEQVATLFDEDRSPVLCRHIASDDRDKLSHWGCIEELAKSNILDVLESNHPPKPDTWRQLLRLWAYVSSDVAGYHYQRNHKNVRIVPVQGKDVLYSEAEVVRLGEKKLLQSQDDWEFLSEYLLVVNQNWPRFLAEQRRKAGQRADEILGEQVEAAYEVLNALGLNEASDVSRVIKQVSAKVFAQDDCLLEICVRLSQLAATLGASVSDEFQFVTRDGCRTPVNQQIIADLDGDLDRFVDEEWYEAHVLNEEYWREFTSCTESEWQQWISSGRSKLLTFVPLAHRQGHVWSRRNLCEFLRKRGLDDEPYYPYVTSSFILDDWDFDAGHWQHWRTKAEEDDEFWGCLFARILNQPQGYWSKAASARALQVATTGNTKAVTHEPLLPAWIVRFRDLPCLQDTRGRYCQPAELLRRTPETESLLEVEPFVRAAYDTEATRPLLIKLGVRDTPTGPRRLLERLRALATVENPPVYEVEKWYHRLDQILVRCSTEEFQEIKDAFANDKIVLTEKNDWVRTCEVFLNADEEDVPGAAIIHPSVQHLTLWQKIGVADRPTAELALEWLKGLASNRKLSQDELRRVRSILPRYGERIWRECGHWLNLENEWAPVGQLAYKLTMQSLTTWKNLFRPVKQKTANLQQLSAEICEQYPFSELPSLAASIEDRFQDDPYGLPDPQRKPWLIALGNGLRRIALDDQDETKRIRELAHRLAGTGWQVSTELKTVPYIDGTPAGTTRRIDVLWKDSMLYVEDRSMAKMAKTIAQELGRVFGRPDITDALKLCFDRPSEFITEYLEENFKLMPPEEFELGSSEDADRADAVEDKPSTDTSDLTSTEPAPSETDDAAEVDSDGEVSPDTHPKPDEDELDDGLGDDGEDVPEEDEGDVPPLPRRRIRPSRPRLIERFALDKGYERDGTDDRFYHADGSWIEKANGNSFPWEKYSSAGELLQCYWAKDHCIQRDALQLDADVWKLCDEHPDKYTLLLVDAADAPLEITGRRLREMRDGGELTLFPAKYRLVYQQHDQGDAGRQE